MAQFSIAYTGAIDCATFLASHGRECGYRIIVFLILSGSVCPCLQIVCVCVCVGVCVCVCVCVCTQ